jgi:hypothetical protein
MGLPRTSTIRSLPITIASPSAAGRRTAAYPYTAVSTVASGEVRAQHHQHDGDTTITAGPAARVRREGVCSDRGAENRRGCRRSSSERSVSPPVWKKQAQAMNPPRWRGRPSVERGRDATGRPILTASNQSSMSNPPGVDPAGGAGALSGRAERYDGILTNGGTFIYDFDCSCLMFNPEQYVQH